MCVRMTRPSRSQPAVSRRPKAARRFSVRPSRPVACGLGYGCRKREREAPRGTRRGFRLATFPRQSIPAHVAERRASLASGYSRSSTWRYPRRPFMGADPCACPRGRAGLPARARHDAANGTATTLHSDRTTCESPPATLLAPCVSIDGCADFNLRRNHGSRRRARISSAFRRASGRLHDPSRVPSGPKGSTWHIVRPGFPVVLGARPSAPPLLSGPGMHRAGRRHGGLFAVPQIGTRVAVTGVGRFYTQPWSRDAPSFAFAPRSARRSRDTLGFRSDVVRHARSR